jgi:hypothetical protein
MSQARKMMGFEIPGDQKIPVTLRDWNGLKLGLWRSKVAWEIAAREAVRILSGCGHLDGCPGAEDDTQPCIAERYEKSLQDFVETDEDYATRQAVRVQEGCPDRELRMSALVILNAARMFAPLDARRAAADPYFAPSREYFSEVISELGAAQIEILVLREALRVAGVEVPTPPPVDSALTERAPPPQLPQEST